MRLLFDENLSPALASRLVDITPGSAHVREVGLLGADDLVIWRYAAENDYIIITKDDDYSDLSILHGAPPKVVLLRVGNCPSSTVASFIRDNIENIQAFASDAESSLLEIPG